MSDYKMDIRGILGLGEYSDIHDYMGIVDKNDNVFVGDKIMIIPSYLSKGLEFDAVIVSDASDNNYGEHERNLLYVVLTRALHKLEVFYSGNLTNIISGANDEGKKHQ